MSGLDLLLVKRFLATLQVSSTQVCDPVRPALSEFFDLADTVGTTLILLATNAFQAYQKAIGATVDRNSGLLTVSSESQLQSLFFNIGGVSGLLSFCRMAKTSV